MTTETVTHTPGPWEFHAQGDANHYALLTPDGRWIMAILQNGEMMTPKQEANARLIAAAPELLEALKGCVSELNQWMAHHGDDLSTKEKIAVAKAAIAKTKS